MSNAVTLNLTDPAGAVASLRKHDTAGAGSWASIIADQIERQISPAEPSDPAARVIDNDGDAWAMYDGKWRCLTTSTPPKTWRELVDVFGPVEVRA